MKKAFITLAAGLLLSNLAMALSTPGSASDVPYVAPCGKVFIKQYVSRYDRKSNFYAQMSDGSSVVTPSSSRAGKSAN